MNVTKFSCSTGHETDCNVPENIAEIIQLPCKECGEYVKLIPDCEPQTDLEQNRQEFTRSFIPVLIEQSFRLSDANYWRGFTCGAITAAILVGIITIIILWIAT